MVNDPDRLAQIAADAARTERAWREPPPEGFGSVLDRSPARGEMADAVEPDRRRRKPDEPVVDAVAEAAPPAKPTTTTRQSPRAPDPRERLLRAQLDARQTATTTTKPTPRAGETPPTGTVAPLPRGGR